MIALAHPYLRYLPKKSTRIVKDFYMRCLWSLESFRRKQRGTTCIEAYLEYESQNQGRIKSQSLPKQRKIAYNERSVSSVFSAKSQKQQSHICYLTRAAIQIFQLLCCLTTKGSYFVSYDSHLY